MNGFFLLRICNYDNVIYFIMLYVFHMLYWGRKWSLFLLLARDHISWRDFCFYATIILFYNLYFIYFIYYIEAENDPGFRRWFEIIFHEGFCSRRFYYYLIIIFSLYCFWLRASNSLTSFLSSEIGSKAISATYLLPMKLQISLWEKAETAQEDEEQILQDVTPPSSRFPWCVVMESKYR